MSLVTVQRTSSPKNAPDLADGGELQTSSTLTVPAHSTPGRQRSFSESYFTVKGAALILPQGECIRNITKGDCLTGGDIQNHLQSMFYMLRAEDTIKVAVKLESVYSNRVRYMAVVSCIGSSEKEESVILGFDCNDTVTLGLVLPLWAETSVRLDGDGGFLVASNMKQHIFKPVSVQAMWSVLQSLHKCCEISHKEFYHVGGTSHAWLSYYKQRINSDLSMVNEWYMLDEYAATYQRQGEGSEEEMKLRNLISSNLRKIMMDVDLDEVTGKLLRTSLEAKLGVCLKEYRGFIDQESLLILGQMDSASEIFSFLYLGTEWNAGNLEELRKNGITHILNCTREIDNFFPGMFEYMNIREDDVEETDLLKYWDKTYRFIQKARMNGSNVFVHCKMGVSRSASTVIAYLMKEFGWSLEKTIKYVAERRPIIRPNSGFMEQLHTYKGILDASGQRHNPLYRSKSETNLQSKCLESTLIEDDENLESEEEEDKNMDMSNDESDKIFDIYSSASEGEDNISSDAEDADEPQSPGSGQMDFPNPANTLKSKATDLTSKHARLLDSKSRFKSFSSPQHPPLKTGRFRRVNSLPDLHKFDEDDFDDLTVISSTWTAEELKTTTPRIKPDDHWIRAEEEDPSDPEVAQERLRRGSFDGAPSFGIDLQMKFSDTMSSRLKKVGFDESEPQDDPQSPVVPTTSLGTVQKRRQKLEKGKSFEIENSEVESDVLVKKRRSGVVSREASEDMGSLPETESKRVDMNQDCDNMNTNALLALDDVDDIGRKDSRPAPGFVQRTLGEIEDRNRRKVASNLAAFVLANVSTPEEETKDSPKATVQRSQSLKENRVTDDKEESPPPTSLTSKSEESLHKLRSQGETELSSSSANISQSSHRTLSESDVDTLSTAKRLNLPSSEPVLATDAQVSQSAPADDCTPWSETVASKILQEEVPLEPGKVKRRTQDFEQYYKQSEEWPIPPASVTGDSESEHRMDSETLHLIREIGSQITGNLDVHDDADPEDESKPKQGLVKRITMAIERKKGKSWENKKAESTECKQADSKEASVILNTSGEKHKNDFMAERKIQMAIEDTCNTVSESQSIEDGGDNEMELLERSKSVSKRLSQFEDNLNSGDRTMSVDGSLKLLKTEPNQGKLVEQSSVEKPDHNLNEKEGYVWKRRSQFEENTISDIAKIAKEDAESESEVEDSVFSNEEMCDVKVDDNPKCEEDISVKNLVGRFETKTKPDKTEPYNPESQIASFINRPLSIEIDETSSSVKRTQSMKSQKSPSPPWIEALLPSRERSSSWSEKSKSVKLPFHRCASDKFDDSLLLSDDGVKMRKHHGKTHPLSKLAARKSAEQSGSRAFYIQ